MTRTPLEADLRAEELLLPSDRVHETRLVDLYDDVCDLLGATRPVDRLLARSITADLWKIDRETGDGPRLLAQIRASAGPAARRRALYREIDDSMRLRSLLIANIVQHMELRDALHKGLTADLRRRTLRVLEGGA